MALQPAHERVAVVELHRVSVFQTAPSRLEPVIGLPFRPVKQADPRDHRRARHPADDFVEQILQPIEMLGGLDEMLQTQRVAFRCSARRPAVLLLGAQPGDLVAEHLRLLHPADPLQGTVRHVRQHLARRLDVLDPVDAGVAGRDERIAVRKTERHDHRLRMHPHKPVDQLQRSRTAQVHEKQ